ncbi:MAG: wax ester/triacylglycerol synthase family O-acyltransferase [Acidimicrobiales bacterium]|nr:wax ester/triacylglycerol synthase family O-acyltransferase [Acidimicrobiales bacterium]
MDRMNPIDVSFLHIEDSDRAAGLHIGSIGIFEGPPPPQSRISALVDGRLDLVPRYRQRVVTVPMGLGRPVWVDDDAFELDYHLRRTALPSPGDEETLRRLTGRIMSQRLDRTKPLWEIWIVEGLTGDRWAMISKVHHCMVDGVSGSELLAVILDLVPEPPEPVPSTWVPQHPPSSAELAADALWELATSQYEQLRAFGSALRRRNQLVEDARTLLTGIASLRDVTAPTPDLTLTGPVGPHREVAWASAPLADVKRVRAEFGGTVNDVVLTAIAGGFRALLMSRGAPLDEGGVRSLVPVSVRATRADGAAAGDGQLDNKISGMFAVLPVAEPDPVVRLERVRIQLAGVKDSHQAVAGEALTSATGFAPPALLALGTRLASRLAARTSNVHTVTTNVPGPQIPLYLGGRRMLTAYPYVPLGAPLRTGVAAFSYDGTVTFGVTGDRDSAGDVAVLAEGIAESLDALVEAAGG